ncbi:MAG: hypothetical protein AB7G88_15080, partial [Thermomicrobiales bacterium]
RDMLDYDRRVSIQPDIVLTSEHQPILVADCKYKRLDDGQFRHHDLYQMVSYCTALDLARGALIYPRHESTLTGEVGIRHSGIRIRFFDVDLGVPHGELAGVMDRLADELIGWANDDHIDLRKVS